MKKISFCFIILLISLYSCKKEEEIVPPRDVAEQASEEEIKLENFLSSHFYNYEQFESSDIPLEISIDTITFPNQEKTALINQVTKQFVKVKTSSGDLIDHPIYTLIAKEGSGQSPSRADSTYVSYKGMLLSKSQFDSSLEPIWFDLTAVVRGFREGLGLFKSGEFTVDQNNVATFSNYGQGIIFMPSGLGYYNNNSGSIPEYSPLIFIINLYLVKKTDHDGDGILSGLEYDNDGDGLPDDSDEDGLADYLDAD
ncbi:MAG: FKBP-type peptidyl-prolyl cis-trans isomerase [Flavobacteriaceae bacterium]